VMEHQLPVSMMPASLTFKTSLECPSCLVVGEISTTFDKYYRLILYCVIPLAVQSFLNLSSLEIIDRTMYVQLILHYGFYNLYDLITLMTNSGNSTENT